MFPSALRREVIAVLCVKALAIALLYLAFFAPVAKIEPGATRAHVLAEPSSKG